jgi:hypothetical protein
MQPFQQQWVFGIQLLVLICIFVRSADALNPSKSATLRSAESYTAAAEADRVLDLPGSPDGLDFAMFAGCVGISLANAGRAYDEVPC